MGYSKRSFRLGLIAGILISILLLALGVSSSGLIIGSALALFGASSATFFLIFMPEVPFGHRGNGFMTTVRALLGMAFSCGVFAFATKAALRISSTFALSVQTSGLIAVLVIALYAVFGIWSLSLVMKFSRSGLGSRKSL